MSLEQIDSSPGGHRAACDTCKRQAEFVYFDSHQRRWLVKDFNWRELFLYNGSRIVCCTSYVCLAKSFRKIILTAMKEALRYPYFANKPEDQTK